MRVCVHTFNNRVENLMAAALKWYVIAVPLCASKVLGNLPTFSSYISLVIHASLHLTISLFLKSCMEYISPILGTNSIEWSSIMPTPKLKAFRNRTEILGERNSSYLAIATSRSDKWNGLVTWCSAKKYGLNKAAILVLLWICPETWLS